VEMEGERGCRVKFARMPRADARLLAMEELRSRGGSRRGWLRLGGLRRGEEERGPMSDLEARSSATAADVEMGFSVVA
jgi:hypothetical protein